MPHRTRLSPLHRALARGTLCLALGGVANANAAAGGQLSARLSTGPAPGEIVFELSNVGDDSVSVLRTDTPLAARLAGDVFDIRDVRTAPAAADRAPYLGRLYKRPAPRPEDFVEIAPGESLSAVVDIERYYDVPAAGYYRVGYHGDIEHIASSARRSRETSLAETHFRTEGPIIALEPSLVALRARPPRFNGCSAEQQNTLVEATAAAEGITEDALSSLEGLAEERRVASPRYRRWFGDYTAARYGAVSDNYTALLGALSGQTLTYDCTCEESAFAYVFPNAPYDIYMCPTFFRANLLGTDSQAGTIVHELSHFTILAGTRDFEYGQRSVAALAATDPGRAVGNADSYEYFAENTPALAMSADSPGGVPNDGGLPNLPLDTVNSGSLAMGDSTTFTVADADRVTLDSMSGDADLFLFASPSFDDGSLLCASENGSGTLDVCAVPDGRTHYVAIRAYSDTRFEVVARRRGGGASAPGVPADEGGFAAGGSGGGGSGGVGWVWLLAGGAAALHRRAPRRAVGIVRWDRRRALFSLACLGGGASVGLLSGCVANSALAFNERTDEAAMDATATLPVTLEAETRRSAYTAALEIRVSARNDTEAPLDLLLWNTPFESVLSADLFEIVREGDEEPLAYRGRLVKRALPPPDEAIVTLAPGESLEHVLDLSRHYALDRPGRYAVALATRGVPLEVAGRDLVALSAADTEPLVVERF